MKKIISIITIVFIIGTMFCGCSKLPAVSAAIGVANTLNNASIDVSGALEKTIGEILSGDGSTLSVFEIDGESYKVGEMVSEYNAGTSAANKKSKKKTYVYQTDKLIKNSVPKTSEIDMLYALTAMVNDVNSQVYDTDNKKMIVIVSNLLSTKGLIDFAHNSIYFDIDSYAEFLKSEMPNMNNISCTWIITEATGEQEKLQQSDKEHLKEFYRTIINNAGGTVDFVEINSDKGAGDRSGWPSVSTVDVRKKEFSGTNDIDITLDEAMLFKPDSTEWIDEKAAEEMLKSLVDAINNSQHKTVIAGSTATTNSSEDRHIQFSKKRADTVRDKLISLGADKNKLISIGIGKSYEKYRVPDTGTFDSETNKSKNRCVFIVSENTDKAQYFESVANRFAINKS